MKRLIVNADDFGLTSGVTEGIVEAHRRGIVTSTSIIASGRAFESAVRHVAANPALGVGIHLTLVEELPVSDPAKIPSLAGPNGRLRQRQMLSRPLREIASRRSTLTRSRSMN